MPPRLTETEKEITRRLRAFRRGHGLTRAAFAALTGLPASKVLAWEHGRAALTWAGWCAVAEQLALNPAWLLRGEGPPARRFDRALLAHKAPEKAHFSKVFAEIEPSPGTASTQEMMAELEEVWQEVVRQSPLLQSLDQDQRDLLMMEMGVRAMRWALEAKRGSAGKTDTAVSVLGKEGKEGKSDTAVSLLEETPKKEQKAHVSLFDDSAKKALQLVPDNVNPVPVNITVPDWKTLRARLLGMVSRRGARTELARDIKVPRSRVTEWLGEKGRPNADQTISLLRWVQKQEEQPKKAPRKC